MPRYLTQELNLGLSQSEVDFVDIDLTSDLGLYIDPYFLGVRNDAFSVEATRTLRSFFGYFLNLIRAGEDDDARALFTHLREPNETGLGQSQGRSQGRGVGAGNADDIFLSLKKSKAVQTGIVEHIEDSRLFVDGIDKDKVSDMATNIIRRHLIDYTKRQCRNHRIPLVNGPTGFMWIRDDEEWRNEYDEILVVRGRKLLLVPKAIVSYSLAYSASQYHQHFILNFLQNEQLTLGGALVEKRKNGTRFVTKKRVKEELAPCTKEYITDFTAEHPEVFAKFKSDVAIRIQSLPHEALAKGDFEAVLDHLKAHLGSLRAGRNDADAYEKVIAAILEVLFYPALTNPELQVEVHNGRKRLDIVYDNSDSGGFFTRLRTTHNIPCQFVFVECKNYSGDPANPELDQLAGRFGPMRGRFGLLVCRTIADMDLFLTRCADTYSDDRGAILPLTDADLVAGLEALKNGTKRPLEGLLQQRLRRIAVA